MSVKIFVEEQTKILQKQIKEAEESLDVLKALGRPTAIEESKIKTAKETLANLEKYLSAD